MDKQLLQQIDLIMQDNVQGALIVDQFGFPLANKSLNPQLSQYVKNIADCATALKDQVPIIAIETGESKTYVIKPGSKFSLCLLA
ncbi:unnamed protein product [Paramecium primaurelia]|uniref:Late endosomal/lysosomal adaptor and MAPK and MTOR activator 5 n=1 Tax=Paramecium primaurelia TaxID=5886 RepID=A0A8S1P3I2_PARPR|nr:unnamed protein product [Paramecium primaurelia]